MSKIDPLKLLYGMALAACSNDFLRESVTAAAQDLAARLQATHTPEPVIMDERASKD